MFQFPWLPVYAYVFSIDQFGNPRVKACLRLTEAYRS